MFISSANSAILETRNKSRAWYYIVTSAGNSYLPGMGRISRRVEANRTEPAWIWKFRNLTFRKTGKEKILPAPESTKPARRIESQVAMCPPSMAQVSRQLLPRTSPSAQSVSYLSCAGLCPWPHSPLDRPLSIRTSSRPDSTGGR
jgi:hypothetical protein